MCSPRCGLLVALLLVASSGPSSAQVPEEDAPAAKLPEGAYISLNPLSLGAFVPSTFTKEVLPYLHNLESGVSVAGGTYLPRTQLEGRLVLGSPSALIFCPQLHAGVRFFPLVIGGRTFPLGVGLFLRVWDTWYTHSGVHFLNLSPQPNIGYVVKMNRFFLDFRFGWVPIVLTGSTLDHSRPALSFTGTIPELSVNIGYGLEGKGTP